MPSRLFCDSQWKANAEKYVHLAYMDESGTDGHCPYAIYGALIIPHGTFSRFEIMHSNAIQQILPLDKIEEFKEFHACDLYLGNEPFNDIEEEKRFTAIKLLLHAVSMEGGHFVYSAAHRESISESPFGTSKPLLSAFHMCLLGVEDWATANHPSPHSPPVKAKMLDWKDTVLYIADDFNQKNDPIKPELTKVYRKLRSKYPWVPPHKNRLWHSHDHMFFADSRDCVGIQMVDLCNYFLKRRISGEAEPQNFIDIFSDRIICAKPEPEWTTFGSLFVELEKNR
jgi:hypothetical protein